LVSKKITVGILNYIMDVATPQIIIISKKIIVGILLK
jgi:hypothetical protein